MPIGPASLQKRFSVAYSRLCHFVALRSDASSVSAAEDGVIRAAIYMCEDATAPNLAEIEANAKAFFSLSFSAKEIDRSIGRLVGAGLAGRTNGSVRLTSEAVTDIEQCVRETQELENQVRQEWIAGLQQQNLVAGAQEDVVWSALKEYLAAMFTRHGVQTLEILAPAAVESEDVDLPASDILDAIIRDKLPSVSIRKGRRIIRSFLIDRTPLRNRYLTELLDGTFSFFALTVDDQTRELLRKNLPPLKLLVDTNFVFGLLDLHSNPYVAVSKELVAVIRAQQFPFQLYYHPLTVKEFQSVLDYHRRKLAGTWTSAISRALLKVGDLSGIERRFHELNADNPTNINDFFARYSNLDRILQSYGITPFRTPYEQLLDDDLTLDLISKYKRFIEPKEKPFETLRHDIVLWRTLREIRRTDPGPFGSGGFFLTCDYTFWRFDHRQLSRGEVGASVLPNVFLQLLRPFVPRTDDFDQSFVSTFALPEFRTIHSASAQAVSRVASIIRLYADLPEDTAAAILSDEAFLAKVANVDESDATLQNLIESAIADEAKRLKAESDRLRDELARQEYGNVQLKARLASAQRVADEHLAAVRRVEGQIEAERETRQRDENEVTRRLQEAQQEADQQRIRAERAEELHQHAAQQARTTDELLGEERGRTSRLRRIVLALAHALFALIVAVIAPRILAITPHKRDILFVGCGVYALVAAALEQLTWFQRRSQAVAARVLWVMLIATLVPAAWIWDINNIRTQLLLGTAATIIVGLISALFSADTTT